MRTTCLVLQSLLELMHYEITLAMHGSGKILEQVHGQPTAAKKSGEEWERTVSEAVEIATCLYFKPVLCLQRSVCAVRMLRRRGVPARLVIGYRPAPFFSHAWVDVAGRVTNGSQAYPERLRVLHVI
jgi:Transglutaminase-like superfamily